MIVVSIRVHEIARVSRKGDYKKRHPSAPCPSSRGSRADALLDTYAGGGDPALRSSELLLDKEVNLFTTHHLIRSSTDRRGEWEVGLAAANNQRPRRGDTWIRDTPAA